MAAGSEVWGEFEGQPVRRVTLSAEGLTARVITWGAVLQDLRLDPFPHPLVLGCPEFASYPAHSPSFGAICGRVANRIGGARFELGGREHRLDANYLGKHTLHGGRAGTSRMLWSLTDQGPAHAVLTLRLEDGHMGFPGALAITLRYGIAEGPALTLDIEARSDAATFCNLAHHSYFNLDATPDVRAHRFRVAAEHFLPVDDERIPTGERRPVAGTGRDYREARPIGPEPLDHNFCLSEARTALRPVASLVGPETGIAMTVETTEPGLQVYDGALIRPGGPAGLAGVPYAPFAGLALEPQAWPDAPNRGWRAQAELRPGQTYRQQTVFRFARGASR